MLVKLLKKTAAGACFGMAFICATMLIDVSTNSEMTSQKRQDLRITSLFFGLPSLATGSWFVWSLRRQREQTQSDRLQSIFFELLQQGQGHVGVLPFAMAAKLDASEAKDYLDEQVRAFKGDFRVSEAGQVFYYFDLDGGRGLDHSELSESNAGGTLPWVGRLSLNNCDVVLEDYAGSRKREVLRVLKQQSQVSWSEAKRLLEQLPATLQTDLDRAEAEALRQRLETAGAQVSIRLR